MEDEVREGSVGYIECGGSDEGPGAREEGGWVPFLLFVSVRAVHLLKEYSSVMDIVETWTVHTKLCTYCPPRISACAHLQLEYIV